MFQACGIFHVANIKMPHWLAISVSQDYCIVYHLKFKSIHVFLFVLQVFPARMADYSQMEAMTCNFWLLLFLNEWLGVAADSKFSMSGLNAYVW